MTTASCSPAPSLTAHCPARPWAELGRRPLPFETSQPLVFATGDVRSGSMKRVAAAVGDAASAIRSVHTALGSTAAPGASAVPVRASPSPTEAPQVLASGGLTPGSPQTKRDYVAHGGTVAMMVV
jgi:hypothetical protein